MPHFLSLKAGLLHLLLVEGEERQFRFKAPDLATIENTIRCIQQDPHSYDLVCGLVGEGLLQEVDKSVSLRINDNGRRSRAINPPPPELKFIMSQMLTGVFRRPKQIGTPTKFGRDVMIYIAIEHACAQFHLKPTRAPTIRPQQSGCDALCKAVAQLGLEAPSFTAIRGVWQSKSVREYIRHVREMEIAIRRRDAELVDQSQQPKGEM